MLPSGSVNLVTTEGTINGATSITDNQWHHVAITWDAEIKKPRIFVDGVEESGGTPGEFNGREDEMGSHSRLGKNASGPLGCSYWICWSHG